ncbi:MAG: hypothetical protein SFV17_26005 [Candidatus Obscuribacter sp.]|nr:hypothetical protein [Candidatus Obscuribacter sp.]
MPYVRSHGNQVVLVHGERDKLTGKVVQRKLFTLYSKVEAAAATGENNQADTRYFRQLLEEANPDIKFDWNSINRDIRQKMAELPDLYPVRQARSEGGFQKSLDEFMRQILLTDPQSSKSGQEILNKYAVDLMVLVKFIFTRLDQSHWHSRDTDEENLLADNDQFCWRYEVQGKEVPADIEDMAAELYESGDYDEAKRMFEILTRLFPTYAEGYNWLGLIDLKEEKPKEAVENFRKTVKYGRMLFPKRLVKSSYWNDHSTRPYIRGMKNLCVALIQAGRYKESLDICQQLERECGDAGDIAAPVLRAAAYLNLHYWELSFDTALERIDLFPSEGFIAGYAAYELNRERDAIELFLHAALNKPHTACMLMDRKEPKCLCNSEADDHNSGIELCRLLPRFWQMQSKQSRKFFKKLGEVPLVRELIDEAIDCTRNHSTLRGQEHSTNFKRWQELESRKFAEKKTPDILRQLNESMRRKVKVQQIED